MNAHVRSFSKAVAAGTIAGGGPFLIVTIPLAVADLFDPITGQLNVFDDLYLAVLPLLVSFALVLFGSVVIGIPTALILRKGGWESHGLYASVGAAAGFLIPSIGLIIADGELGGTVGLGLLGALSGTVTGVVWWKATSRAN